MRKADGSSDVHWYILCFGVPNMRVRLCFILFLFVLFPFSEAAGFLKFVRKVFTRPKVAPSRRSIPPDLLNQIPDLVAYYELFPQLPAEDIVKLLETYRYRPEHPLVNEVHQIFKKMSPETFITYMSEHWFTFLNKLPRAILVQQIDALPDLSFIDVLSEAAAAADTNYNYPRTQQDLKISRHSAISFVLNRKYPRPEERNFCPISRYRNPIAPRRTLNTLTSFLHQFALQLRDLEQYMVKSTVEELQQQQTFESFFNRFYNFRGVLNFFLTTIEPRFIIRQTITEWTDDIDTMKSIMNFLREQSMEVLLQQTSMEPFHRIFRYLVWFYSEAVRICRIQFFLSLGTPA